MAIEPWQGGIINPLTRSGRILAGHSYRRSSSSGSGSGDGDSERLRFVVATTVFDSPHQALYTMATMPSFFKLGSFLFPQQLQASSVVHASASAVASTTLLIQNFLRSLLPKKSSNNDQLSRTSMPALQRPLLHVHSYWLLQFARHSVVETTFLVVHAGFQKLAWFVCVALFMSFDLLVGGGFLVQHLVLHVMRNMPELAVHTCLFHGG